VRSGPVVMFSLGGTIAMAGHNDGGVVTRLTGHDLMAGLGPLERGLDVQVHDLGARPSADLTFDDVLDAVDAAGQAVADGARGIVLTQGTDTLEETAFLVDAVWPHDAPFVLTGAMRNPTLPGADGPANLSAALRVAASEAARDRGALVVLDNQVHAAAHVRKSHSTSLAAFTSPDLGPVGRVVEDVPRFLADVPRRPTVTGFSRARLAATRIALHLATFDDDGATLDAVAASHQGLVVAGFGVGHVPGALAPGLGALTERMPVVLTSRTGAGPVLARTYGAVGSERDLLERGLVNGGFLHPYKARVLLRLLVAAGAGREHVAAGFASYS
jgi:L-asparaginase